MKWKQLEIGSGAPKICVPIMGSTEEEILREARLAAASGGDLAEWRVDPWPDILNEEKARTMLTRIAELLGEMPILFTFRSRREGGVADISPENYERLLFWAAGQEEISGIDVESRDRKPAAVHPEGEQDLEGQQQIVSWIRSIQEKGKTAVASAHFFSETPSTEKMEQILEEQEQMGAGILKLAVMPENREDVWRLLEVTHRMAEKTDRPLITMAMGRLGAVSRIMGAFTGSAVTFMAAGRASAPGQFSVETAREILELLG